MLKIFLHISAYLRSHILEIVVFMCGAIVMIFELAGSRILGPYLGTSLFVWTSVIGVILGSLSIGYHYGGKIADNNPHIKTLTTIILCAAVGILLTLYIKGFLLMFIQNTFTDIRISSIISSIILFSPTSIALGMVSPYAAKLRLSDLATSGITMGNLYAISTTGSIVGTFLAGFYFIPQFGTNLLLIILSLLLLITSLLLSYHSHRRIIMFFFVLSLCNIIGLNWIEAFFQKAGFVDIDTAYNRVWIYTTHDDTSNEDIRTLSINNELSSAMFLNKDDLVFDYTKFYHLARHFHPDFSTALMFGGAGYSYPKEFLTTYPQATIDVVEIDPQITEIARSYFRLTDHPHLRIMHQDGRVFLNTSHNTYDVIFGDAFSSQFTLPYHMTTREAVQHTYDMLNDDGVAIINIVSSINGDTGRFLRAEYATYAEIFPHILLFPVQNPQNDLFTQNIMIVALKSSRAPTLTSTDPEIAQQLQHLWTKNITMDLPPLTDDHAPVDHYISTSLQKKQRTRYHVGTIKNRL